MIRALAQAFIQTMPDYHDSGKARSMFCEANHEPLCGACVGLCESLIRASLEAKFCPTHDRPGKARTTCGRSPHRGFAIIMMLSTLWWLYHHDFFQTKPASYNFMRKKQNTPTHSLIIFNKLILFKISTKEGNFLKIVRGSLGSSAKQTTCGRSPHRPT
jgi:hypothetical protein